MTISSLILISAIFIILVLILFTSPWRQMGMVGTSFWQVSIALNYDRYPFFTPFVTGEGYAHLPPLYSWIIYSAMVGTGHVEAGRLVSFMFGIGTLFLTFKICASLFGRKTGYLAMLILATSPLFIMLSTVMMPETTILFFSALSILFLMKFLETDNNKYLLAMGATAFLSAFAKWSGIFILVGLGSYLIYKKGVKILRNPIFHISLLTPVLLCLIWFLHMLSIVGWHAYEVGIIEYLFFRMKEPLFQALLRFGFEFVILVPLSTLGLALVGIVFIKKEGHLPLFWLMGGVLYYLIFLQGALHGHYSAQMLPPLAILGAQGAITLSSKMGSVIKKRKQLILPILSLFLVLIGFVGIGSISHYLHQRYGHYAKDMCITGELIQKNAGEKGMVVIPGISSFIYFYTSINIARIETMDASCRFSDLIEEWEEDPKIIVALVKNPKGLPLFGDGLSEDEFKSELDKVLNVKNYKLLKGDSYFRVLMKEEGKSNLV